MNIFKAMFRAIFYKLPKPGDIYVFDSSDVFDRVEVIGTYGNWVNYRQIGSYLFDNEYLSRDDFHFCYIKENN